MELGCLLEGKNFVQVITTDMHIVCIGYNMSTFGPQKTLSLEVALYTSAQIYHFAS